MKSFTVMLIAFLALGIMSCDQEDTVANEEALFDLNNNPALETNGGTGNTGTEDDPPEG